MELRQGRDGTVYLTSFQTGTEIAYRADQLIVQARTLHEDRSELISTLTSLIVNKAKAAERRVGETEARFIRAYGLNYHAHFFAGGNGAGKFLAQHLLRIDRIEKVLPILATKITFRSSQGDPRYRLGFEPKRGNVETEECSCQLNIHYEHELPKEILTLQQQLTEGENWFKEHFMKLFPEEAEAS